MSKRSTTYLLVGGGVLTVGGAILAWRRSVKTTDAVQRAVSGESSAAQHDDVISSTGYPVVQISATGYWPYYGNLDPTARKMEGGTTDRKKRPIITLEMHQKDPVKYPYVSVAGDYTLWPDGQRIIVDSWPGVVFRIVDTGGHFFGPKKVFRAIGREPLDFAVAGPQTQVVRNSSAQIVTGDNFEKGKQVSASGFKDQTVMVGATVIGGEYPSNSETNGYTGGSMQEIDTCVDSAHTTDDVEALSRAIESELGGQTKQEQIAAAWAMRNRAVELNTTLFHMLAPRGAYGPTRTSGGYASTRKAPTESTSKIAMQVLSAVQSNDPTNHAIDFWTPHLQTQMHELAGIYNAAVRLGDLSRAKKYERFSGYGSEVDIREKQAQNGLRPTIIIGAIEFLGKS